MRITDYYVAADGMGSVTAIVDEDGNVLERRSYDAFGDMNRMSPDGTPVATSPTGVDVGFQGQIRDEVSGLYQMGYRWYSPVLSRWLSQDPVWLAGGVNLDSFATNSPTKHTDPYGLDIWIEGPSATEPNAHQSINVGNPLGNYYSQSFGTDGFAIWNAGIYVDVNKGGEIEKTRRQHRNKIPNFVSTCRRITTRMRGNGMGRRLAEHTAKMSLRKRRRSITATNARRPNECLHLAVSFVDSFLRVTQAALHRVQAEPAVRDESGCDNQRHRCVFLRGDFGQCG